MTPCDSVPADPDALRALLLAERTHHAEELERLTAIIRELQRHRFGRRAERLDPEQLALAPPRGQFAGEYSSTNSFTEKALAEDRG
jgi:hypothetical protein